MRRLVFVLIAACLATMIWAQAPVGDSKPPAVPVAAPPQVQAQVDAAWKDLQIAQLKLQLIVEQATGQMEKGTYYDYAQQKFMRRVESNAKPAEKPPIKPAPAAK